MLGVRGGVGKNPSPTLVRDSAKIQYISGEQPSSYELTFGVELGTNPHSKIKCLHVIQIMRSHNYRWKPVKYKLIMDGLV